MIKYRVDEKLGARLDQKNPPESSSLFYNLVLVVDIMDSMCIFKTFRVWHIEKNTTGCVYIWLMQTTHLIHCRARPLPPLPHLPSSLLPSMLNWNIIHSFFGSKFICLLFYISFKASICRGWVRGRRWSVRLRALDFIASNCILCLSLPGINCDRNQPRRKTVAPPPLPPSAAPPPLPPLPPTTTILQTR